MKNKKQKPVSITDQEGDEMRDFQNLALPPIGSQEDKDSLNGGYPYEPYKSY